RIEYSRRMTASLLHRSCHRVNGLRACCPNGEVKSFPSSERRENRGPSRTGSMRSGTNWEKPVTFFTKHGSIAHDQLGGAHALSNGADDRIHPAIRNSRPLDTSEDGFTAGSAGAEGPDARANPVFVASR